MSQVETRKVGIIMNGVTGRMGTNQHLMRSIVPIIQEGGLRISDTEALLPDPILVGRNAGKLRKLSENSGVSKWTTNLNEALSDPGNQIYFDAQTTNLRVQSVQAAIEAGKHIYCEKPSAENSHEARELFHLAEAAGVKHGVVQDKLWLPGIQKLRWLRDKGFFGKVVAVRGEFGYWVFAGETRQPQRPSWNYRKEDGGGIILDMLPHWHYLLENLFGKVTAVSCTGAKLIAQRKDESDSPYDCTAEDTAFATFEIEGGLLAHFNSSWVTRVRRDDLVTIQVDGTGGTAVAGLRRCLIQPHSKTPRPVWNPDLESPVDYYADWEQVPDQENSTNAFRAQWELFLRHVAADELFPWDLDAAARGVELAEAALKSWQEKRWIQLSR